MKKSLLEEILAKTSAPHLKVEDVLKIIPYSDSFKDLYPGYSKPADESAVDFDVYDYKFDSQEVAIQEAQEILDMFQNMPDPVPVWRLIHVKKESDIKLRDSMDSWAWDEKGALDFGNSNGLPKPWVMLEGKLPKSKINWQTTILLFFTYSDGFGAGSELELRPSTMNAVKDLKWSWVDGKGTKLKKAQSDITDPRFEEEPYRQAYMDALPFQGPWNGYKQMSPIEKVYPAISEVLNETSFTAIDAALYPHVAEVLSDIIDDRYSDPHGGYRHDSALPIQDTYGWGWGDDPGAYGTATENNPMGQGVRRAFAAGNSITLYRGFKDLKPGQIQPYFESDGDFMYGKGDYFSVNKQTAEYYAYKHAKKFGVVVEFKAAPNLVTFQANKNFTFPDNEIDFSYDTEITLKPELQKQLKLKTNKLKGRDITRVTKDAGFDGAYVIETGPSPMFEDGIVVLVKHIPLKGVAFDVGSAGDKIPAGIRKFGKYIQYPETGWNQVVQGIKPKDIPTVDALLKVNKSKAHASTALAMRTFAKAVLPEGSDLLNFYYSADAEGWSEGQREEGEAEWARMSEKERLAEIPHLISNGYSDHFPKKPKTPADWEEVKDAWLSDYEDNQREYADTTETFFENARIISNPTLVRFTDHVTPEQAKSPGFGFDGYAPKNLGLTHHYRPRAGEGTLAFAFDKKDLKTPNDWEHAFSKYGKYAYEFKVPYAVKAYHNTDGEDQVVFDVETIKDLKVVDRDALKAKAKKKTPEKKMTQKEKQELKKAEREFDEAFDVKRDSKGRPIE